MGGDIVDKLKHTKEYRFDIKEMSQVSRKRSRIERLCNKTIIKPSDTHRYGVFASKNLKEDELIDQCVAIEFPCSNKAGNILNDYVFKGSVPGTSIILFGNGSIYNHSDDNNVSNRAPYTDNQSVACEHDDCEYGTCDKLEKNVWNFYALEDIPKGKELFINYGDRYWETRKKRLKKR